jgi:hypothetical protein
MVLVCRGESGKLFKVLTAGNGADVKGVEDGEEETSEEERMYKPKRKNTRTRDGGGNFSRNEVGSLWRGSLDIVYSVNCCGCVLLWFLGPYRSTLWR